MEYFDVREFENHEYLKNAKRRMKHVKVPKSIFFFLVFNKVKDFAKYTSKMDSNIRKSYDLLSEAVALEKNDIVEHICKNYKDYYQDNSWFYQINSGVIFRTLYKYFPKTFSKRISYLTYSSFRKENNDIVDMIIEFFPKKENVKKGVKNFLESTFPIDRDSMTKIIVNFPDVIESMPNWSICVKNETTAEILFGYNLMNKIDFTSLEFSIDFYRTYALALNIEQYTIEKQIDQISRFLYLFLCGIKIDIEFLLDDKFKYSYIFEKTINLEILNKFTPYIIPDDNGKNKKGENCLYTKNEIRLITFYIRRNRKSFSSLENYWN